MSREINLAVAQLFIDEINQKTSSDIMDGLVDPEYSDDILSDIGEEYDLKGARAVVKQVGILRQAFPNFHYTIMEMIADDDQVVVYWGFKAKHEGEVFGFPPTGKVLTFRGFFLIYFSKGKIIMIKRSDYFKPFLQIGLALVEQKEDEKLKSYLDALLKLGILKK
ncbi:MAG: ester cyclase [Candidatus Kariarchaeaceae archaeon]|jgi:predicted ester cyclase